MHVENLPTSFTIPFTAVIFNSEKIEYVNAIILLSMVVSIYTKTIVVFHLVRTHNFRNISLACHNIGFNIFISLSFSLNCDNEKNEDEFCGNVGKVSLKWKPLRKCVDYCNCSTSTG